MEENRLNINEEYTTIIEELYSQIECYKIEHQSLKAELNLLINENKTLSKNYSDLINTKIENNIENEQITNLKGQIDLLLQEKQSSYELWQNSLKIIEQLEEELSMFRGRPQNYINKIEIEKAKELHSKELTDMQNKMQIFIKELETNNKMHIQNLEQKSKELSLALRGHKEAMHQIKQFEIEIGLLKERINNLQDNLSEKDKIVKEKERHILKLRQIEYEAKIQVAEAINVAEAALIEKNNAVDKENQAKEEISQLTKTIKDIIKEAGEKVNSEVNNIKEECNIKIKEVYKDMKSLKDELNDKNLQIEHEIKKRKNVEEELGKIKYGSTITEDEKSLKILHLEKNLESTFQKLIISERKVVQLTTERESIKLDLDQMCNHFGQATKENEKQKRDLLLEVKQLKNELYDCKTLLEKYENNLRELTVRSEMIERELKTKINDQQRITEMLQENLVRIENQNSLEKNEMTKYLKSERELNKRWKNEVKDITNKLQVRIRELKYENAHLKKHLQSENK